MNGFQRIYFSSKCDFFKFINHVFYMLHVCSILLGFSEEMKVIIADPVELFYYFIERRTYTTPKH